MKSPYFTSLNKWLTQTDENALKKNLTLAFIKWKERRITMVGWLKKIMHNGNWNQIGIGKEKRTREEPGILLWGKKTDCHWLAKNTLKYERSMNIL
jgi:hypothetical protein